MEGEYWWSLVNFDICIEIESEGELMMIHMKITRKKTFQEHFSNHIFYLVIDPIDIIVAHVTYIQCYRVTLTTYREGAYRMERCD